MSDGGATAGSSGGGSLKPATSYECCGNRQRFTIELRPGETTIVSWKKLLRDANAGKYNKPGQSGPVQSSEPAQGSVPVTVPAPAPAAVKQTAENEAKDPPGTNRLSTVIERIERMYAGNGSSDEEDVVLDDVPDDDEYDTEDSFIDDTELDDYFQVDNSAIKHDGFFVNRGKLERMEPTSLPSSQPKKRRRKDLTKGHGGSDDAHRSNKHVKIEKKGRKSASVTNRNVTSESQNVGAQNSHSDDLQSLASIKAAEVSLKKKNSDVKSADPSRLFQVDAIRQAKDIDEDNKLKGSLTQRPNNKSASSSKTQPGVPSSNIDDISQSSSKKEKGRPVERFDLNASPSRNPIQIVKVPHTQRKDGSSVRPKSTLLDKAIRELEKTVAESRPPSREVQDADNSSQAVKRRLPPEIKQKIAKVARLAQASYGKIPKDVINRLMSIVGHLMQLRTLKRNLKIMANMGLSAKQEKDDKVQQIKQEVAEMIKLQIDVLNPQILEQENLTSDSFQESNYKGKEALDRKYSMDDTLEDKICDLYDLYVERFEEDSGPPVRKMYEELAALWPSGVMDTHGIKHAIYRAKDRRRAMSGRQKDEEKIQKRNKLARKADETALVDACNITQPLHMHDKRLAYPSDHGSIRMVPAPTTSDAAVRMPVTFTDNPINKLKQEKVKGNYENCIESKAIGLLPKKKVKRRQEAELVEGQLLPEKLAKAEDGQRQYKQVAAPPKIQHSPSSTTGS